jgi:hypothetical protein
MTIEKGTIIWSAPGSVESLGPLPLRLRDENGTIFAEGMAGSKFEARPGDYRLTIVLPNGVELMSREAVTIEPGGLAEPDFPDLDQGLVDFQRQSGVAKAPKDISSISGCRWCGRWLELWSDAEEGADSADPLAADETLAFEFELGPKLIEVERTMGCDDVVLFRRETGRTAFILPGDRDIGTDGPLRMGVGLYTGGDAPGLHFESPVGPEANNFIRYINRGMLGEARRIILDLLGENSSPPGEMHGSLLRAVMAGYVFLRANELSHADWLTERLCRYAPEVPDVHVIRMEALARLGGADNHQAAVGALRQAIAAGCPWFRSGISYMLERLRLYVGADAADSVDFRLTDAAELEGWKRRFHRMVHKLDANELYTTFNLGAPAAAAARAGDRPR